MANTSARIAVVILAAGSSSRLGRPKQLLPMHGSTLLRVIAREACAATDDGVAVVLGASAQAIAPTLGSLPLTILDNPAWMEGMASSIRVAIAWAQRSACDGCALLVGDQPQLTAGHLARLFTGYRTTGGIVASRYGDVVGVPAVFDRGWFTSLAALHGTRGAQQVIRSADASAITAIDWPDGAMDLDTDDDGAAWSRR